MAKTAKPKGEQPSPADRNDAAEIYGLYDPRDGALRYIGKAKCSVKRLQGHVRDSRRRNTPVYCWFRKLAELGMIPTVAVLERSKDWREAERRLIADGRAKGERLLNLADGGDEPFCPREVRVANAKLVAKIRQIDPEAQKLWQLKRTLGSALRSGHLMNKTRQKMREAARLKPHVFGLWANIPDRMEAADGSPV